MLHISSCDRSRLRGFTLIEILLSLSLVAMLLLAVNSFVFSMGELWGKGGDQRLFDRHVRAVTRYVQDLLRTAVLPPASLVANNSLGVQEIRPPDRFADNLLTFELPEGTRQISWPEQPLPDVVCSLAVRDQEGLVLYWHSRLETKFDDDPPRSTVLSPLVTAITYYFYDDNLKSWSNSNTIQKDSSGAFPLPMRLRLKFAYGPYMRETVITVPSYNNNALPPF